MKKIILLIGIVMILLILVGCSYEYPIDETNTSNYIMASNTTIEPSLRLTCSKMKVVLDYGNYTINMTMKDFCDKLYK